MGNALKTMEPSFPLNSLLVALLASLPVQAAFIIQPNGLAASNYSAGTTATNSTLAGDTLLQAPGLTPGVASLFGGEPYTYTYTPGTDGNNITTWTSGTVLNGAGGLNASGLLAGSAGFYNIYHVFPQTTNANGQPTLYQIFRNGGTTGVTTLIASQNQNVNDTNASTSGVGIGLWERIGQVAITDPSQTITVTVDATTSGTFVGARTAGVLFDYAGPIPEPSSIAMLGLGGLAFAMRRIRR